MCGIVGFLGLQGRAVDTRAVEAMSKALIHRGPDDSGTHFAEWVGFGFRRLAIQDLSQAGHQPMKTGEPSVTIVFNGEIYNFVELREDLTRLGYIFSSGSDTEVLLKAYHKWGTKVLPRLNGMFAFAIHDQRTGTVFCARDRFGIKPLFLYRSQDVLLFASEIKAIRGSGVYEGDNVDWGVAARYLVRGRADEGERTFFDGIVNLSPGTAFEINAAGEKREWRYWELAPDGDTTDPDAPEKFAELFEESVRLRMRSDVPVGVCLSGGMDSTSIVCSMARFIERRGMDPENPLVAFSHNPARFDESRYLDGTFEQTGARQVPLHFDPENLWDLIPRVLKFHDEPFHSLTAVVSFELMKLAHDHGTPVLLNGQGADEVLGGYQNYFHPQWFSLLRRLKLSSLFKDVREFSRAHHFRQKDLWSKLIRQLASHVLSQVPGHGAFRKFRKGEPKSPDWFDPGFASQEHALPHEKNINLNETLKGAVEHYPLPLYLRTEDRNAMAHSIETRLPFLDHRLVAYAFSLAGTHKVSGKWNKNILRQAMKRRIPESVRTRVDKMGFPVSQDDWVVGVLYEPICDLLSSQKTRERGIYSVPEVLQSLERAKANRVLPGRVGNTGNWALSLKIVRIVQFEMWADGLAGNLKF